VKIERATLVAIVAFKQFALTKLTDKQLKIRL